MARVIKRFSNNSILEFAKGRFDEWCVYFTNAEGKRKPPLDLEYFAHIKNLAKKYGTQNVYNDYVKIYDLTGNDIDQNILNIITNLSNKYNDDALSVEILLTTLYVTMIAEENKKYAPLGKRIKRLGIHKLLINNYSISDAATFMKKKKWRELDAECKNLGF